MSNKFHFQDQVFKHNRGKIQIGETIHNHGEEHIVINQTEILTQMEQIHKEVRKAKELDESIRKDLLEVLKATESELQQPNPNLKFLSKMNKYLQKLQPSFTGWQAITATISALCDLLPKG